MGAGRFTKSPQSLTLKSDWKSSQHSESKRRLKTPGRGCGKLKLFRRQRRNRWRDPDVDMQGVFNIAFAAGCWKREKETDCGGEVGLGLNASSQSLLQHHAYLLPCFHQDDHGAGGQKSTRGPHRWPGATLSDYVKGEMGEKEKKSTLCTVKRDRAGDAR